MKVDMMIRTAALVAASLFGAAIVAAQGGAASAGAPVKIGTLSGRLAIAGTAEGKQAGDELQSQFAPRQNELDSMNKQVNDMRQRLAAGERTLSEDEKARLQREGEALVRRMQRKQDEFQEDVTAAQNEVFDRIGRKMVDVLERYARENGYVAIFDTSAQNTPILYASSSIDVTQDIVKLYDQAYPVKAATTAKPAAARPAPAQQPAAAKP